MKHFRNLVLILIVSFHFVFAQNGFDKQESIYHLSSNLEYLASDYLEGREATTRGEELASIFLSAKLKEYNVKPFGDDGKYFQYFNVLTKQTESDSEIEIISEDGETSKLLLGDDFALSLDYFPSAEFNDKDYEVVFAGYGLTDEESNYDDYAGIDVDGKVVLVIVGSPSTTIADSATFKDYKKYFNIKSKYENAQNRGAAGLIVVPDSRTVKYWAYIRVRALTSTSGLAYESNDQTYSSASIPVIRLSEESAIKLLSNELYDYDDLSKVEDGITVPPSFRLNKKIRFDYRASSEIKEARNVIGIVEGTDDDLKNEFIALSAHYDHEGIVDSVIYNGADDNGSGTVGILEAARRLSQIGKNKRSVLFVFHTAEEKGLLGSKYYTNNSEYMDDIVTNINVDMVGRESTDSIFCIGSDKLSTELYEMVEEVNSETVNFYLDYTYNDPDDPNRYYYRSDHYNYAKRNIPVVFFYDHMVEDYHKPTDDVDKINFEKIEKISTLITELALRISNLDHRLIVDKLEMEAVK
ncbi:MAG: M20/M25/M40 family metallo-hydrolase [Ignavibacterium sp.]|nr:MAG: M20/M25/M40 family metallo-hydrolase [Ignavibacterium sp.]